MKPILPALLSALILAGCSAPPIANESVTIVNDSNDAITVIDEPENAAALPADANTLTAAGLGDLRIGMSRADLVAAFGGPSAASTDPQACEEFHPAKAPAGVLVMIEQGKLTRISLIRDAALKSDAGFGIGATSADVKAAYGARATSTPHKYVEAPAEYITIWSSGSGGAGSLGLVYEIGKDGKVTAIRAGGPAIQYVEGCA